MDYSAIFAVNSAGMTFEKARLDVAALNLANMHASFAAGGAGYRPLRAVAEPLRLDFSSLVTGSVGGGNDIPMREVHGLATNAVPRLVSDPGHPHADERGMVRMPGVDQSTEMIAAMTALRAYEANVAAAGLARTMAMRALELGGS